MILQWYTVMSVMGLVEWLGPSSLSPNCRLYCVSPSSVADLILHQGAHAAIRGGGP